VNDACIRIDQDHAGGKAVECIGEGCGLGSLQIDHPADQRRAANMRNEEACSPTHFIVHHAVAQVAKDDERSNARDRFFEHDIDAIDKTQRLRPFPVEARCNEFVVRDDIGRGHWLFYGGEEQAGRGGVELAVFIKILLTMGRIDAPSVKRTAPRLLVASFQ
jgi:hypothetical protein